MKSKLILSLSVLGLSVGMLGMGIPTSANSIEEEVVNPNVRGVGYYWKCRTCGYHSNWHALASTAVSKANVHAQKYNHVTSVYPN